jgi:hypothetical protein
VNSLMESGKGRSPVVFPVEYTDDDGTHYTLEDVRGLEERVEFADDHDPDYYCVDASGRRVRLIVWKLELLVAQAVPSNYDAGHLCIVAEHTLAYSASFEMYSGTPLRSIVRKRSGEVLAEPLTWDTYPTSSVKFESPRSKSGQISEFHRQWMYHRTGDKYWRSRAG